MAAPWRKPKLLGALVLPILLTAIDVLDAAYTSTPGPVSGCIGGSATFTWVYDNPGDAVSVIWDFGAINVFNFQPSTGNIADGAGQFAGRVTHNGDGSITLTSLTASDSGSYTCTTTYGSNPTATDAATLNVNAAFTDSISTVLTKSGSTATVNLGSQNGVGVEWKNAAGTVVGTGTTFTGEGTFTVCLTGCVSGSATACQQVELGPPCDTTCMIIICVVVIYVLGIGAVLIVVAVVRKFCKRCPCCEEYTGIGCRAKCVIICTILGMGIIVAVVILIVLGKEKKLPCQKGSQQKKPDSGNSGSRSVTPNQVSPSIITTDKKIERSSKVNEKNTKPFSPSALSLTNEAKPGGRALPPIPQHEKKKKTPRKKKKRVKTEDGEDTEKLPPIQKKERNIEHYTRDTQDPES